jgi:hypothetical protein
MGDCVSDRCELFKPRLLPLQDGSEGLSILKPTVSSLADVRHIPFCVVFSVCAPFGGGFKICREAAAGGTWSLRRFVADEVEKECFFEENLPTGECAQEPASAF